MCVWVAGECSEPKPRDERARTYRRYADPTQHVWVWVLLACRMEHSFARTVLSWECTGSKGKLRAKRSTGRLLGVSVLLI